MHELITDGRYPNCRMLAEEFEVSTKTVQRDINFMRDRMSLPMEYDKARFGFRYTRPVNGLPAMPATPVKSTPAAAKWDQFPYPGRGPRAVEGNVGGVRVRLHFDRECARAVRARRWHATQVARSLPDGGVELTLDARDEMGIARWVLSWAGHAWVIEPARLRSKVREIARDIAARH